MAREVEKGKKMHVKKGDIVMVIAGKDAGKKGKVIMADKKNGRVMVEKANIISRHTKPTNASPQGGIIKKEAAMDSSNVMLYCNKCAAPVRVKKNELPDGKKIRVCTKCGENFDK